MLIFLATFLGLFSLYMLLQTVRPLVERTVITSDDWQRIDDQSSELIGRRDRLLDELRDLEFEASLNKIVGRDLDELRRRYEGEALAVMAKLEAEAKTFEGRIGRDIDNVIATAQARRDAQALTTDAVHTPSGESPAAKEETSSSNGSQLEAGSEASSTVDKEPAHQICPSCGSENRPQARFCDTCGGALEANP